jgi:hypothetical protein
MMTVMAACMWLEKARHQHRVLDLSKWRWKGSESRKATLRKEKPMKREENQGVGCSGEQVKKIFQKGESGDLCPG